MQREGVGQPELDPVGQTEVSGGLAGLRDPALGQVIGQHAIDKAALDQSDLLAAVAASDRQAEAERAPRQQPAPSSSAPRLTSE